MADKGKNSVEGIVSSIATKHGEETASMGYKYREVERIPTGIFPFDLSTGGGFPRGKVSVIYGPESSGKTNHALLCLKQAQMIYPDEKHIFMDVEHSFDPKWAEMLGIDVDQLAVLQPNFAEEAIDMVQAVMSAEDSGVIVVDSVAALTPEKEADASSERQQVGGNSLLIGNMMRKVIVGLTKEAKNDHYPTPILINQVRTKIGVMFGNPEGMPGGHALKHASGMTVRTYGKNLIEKAISDSMPAYKETKTVIQKWKVPIVSVNSEYNIAMIPTGKLNPGECDDWNTIAANLKDTGEITKTGSSWFFDGEEFKTLKAIKEKLESDPYQLYVIKQKIIQRRLEECYGKYKE